MKEKRLLISGPSGVGKGTVVNEILKAIESEYDLNYGEILINPRDFWDLVEGYR